MRVKVIKIDLDFFTMESVLLRPPLFQITKKVGLISKYDKYSSQKKFFAESSPFYQFSKCWKTLVFASGPNGPLPVVNDRS